MAEAADDTSAESVVLVQRKKEQGNDAGIQRAQACGGDYNHPPGKQ